MLCYIYDSTFEGLLTCIYEALQANLISIQIIPEDNAQPNLFAEMLPVNSNPTKAHKLLTELRQTAPEVLKNIFYVWLAEAKDFEGALLEYIRLAFKYQDRVNLYHSNNFVRQILDLSGKVGGEAQRIKGLLRFRKLKNNTYYAPLEPDHNILPLLGAHFSKRLADQKWVIHDVKRGTVLVNPKLQDHGRYPSIAHSLIYSFNTNTRSARCIEDSDQQIFSEDEKSYQELWQTFYKSINIKSRKNPKVQKQFMPRRYWKYLVEQPG